MDAIFLLLRTGCQWNALHQTRICSSSSAHRRFQEWVKAGVFAAFWRKGLLAYDALQGIEWTWLALDGAISEAPLGGEKNRPRSDQSGERRVKRSLLTDRRWSTLEGMATAESMTSADIGAALARRQHDPRDPGSPRGALGCGGSRWPPPVGLGSTGNRNPCAASMLGTRHRHFPLSSSTACRSGCRCAGFPSQDARLFAIAAAIRNLLAEARLSWR